MNIFNRRVGNNIFLGSCRLSIFDLSNKANMPMQDASGRYTITYNGEIYNFIEIKKKFKINTKTDSDTEVLIELYSLLKEKCLNELNGIFSFIIYDSHENIFFCARDRLGVKPLYYQFENKKLIISSEIKSFQKLSKLEINKNTLNDYLKTSLYEMGKYTFFKNIYQLEQGQIMEFNIKRKNIKFSKYWNLNEKKTYIGVKKQILYDKLNKKILNSFKGQIQTDTELGINVSSGIDSKLLMLCLNRINNGQKKVLANSYYFDDKEFSEKNDLEKFAKKLCKRLNF